MDMDELNRLLDVPFTFSRWCVSGLTPTYAPRCECWRCREERGESRDEVLAEKVSREARKGWDQWMAEFVRKMQAGEVGK